MEKQEFLQIVDRYLQGQATEGEEKMLRRFFNSFSKEVQTDDEISEAMERLENRMLQRLMQSVKDRTEARQKPAHTHWLSLFRYAAVFLSALLIIGLIPYLKKLSKPGERVAVSAPLRTKSQLSPGGNKAVLKLSDGSVIVLSQASNGVLKTEGNTTVRKTKDGHLIYESKESDADADRSPNTIITPRGGQYQLTLSDGTRVWLNSQSVLTFPSRFHGWERRVHLSGEAYFEVAKAYINEGGRQQRMPFYVDAGTTTVKVLGTHFNIMAYPSAGLQETTLLEGAVMVSNGTSDRKIVPGEQAVIRDSNDRITVRAVSTESIMAWKEGLFWFENTNIDEAMAQIQRWYDAEIVYEGVKPDVAFTGVLPRSSDVAVLLRLLESTRGVKFRTEGRKIIVRSK